MDDILKPSVTDPHGDRALKEVAEQDLTALSVTDLEQRIAILKEAIAACEKELASRDGVKSAAEALFKK